MSTKTVARFFSFLLAVGFTTSACTDASAPLGEDSEHTPQLHHVAYTDSFQVEGLKRTSHLGGVTVRATIDPRKESYVPIPSAGFAIWIPKRALRHKTEITITVLPGEHIAYRFEPHGLVFNEQIIGIQSLKGTKVEGDSAAASTLGAGYFATDTLELDATGQAKVVEFEAAGVDHKNKYFYFAIPHFSGYMVALGVRGAREF